jgi:predicted dehydrogenase
MPSPVPVGLVGAGPWASMVHAPMLASNPNTRLAGVWARRAEAAAALAAANGTKAYESIDALFDACEAVAFSVPPDVQAEVATRAALARKHLLLEKPIADRVATAERLVGTVERAGVRSMLLLTWRYSEPVRSFLAGARAQAPFAGRAHFISGGLLGGPFATPWRLERGPLVDLGPHVIDLLDAVFGRVDSVDAHGDVLGWVSLDLGHEGGAISQAALCASVPVDRQRAGIELYGPGGALELDCAAVVGPDTFVTVADELATMVRSGEAHPLDAAHGLYLQRVIEEAEGRLLEGAGRRR